jgi:hypothetical protein
MRQIETAGAVARVMRVLLTKHKERQHKRGLQLQLQACQQSLTLQQHSRSFDALESFSPKSPATMKTSAAAVVSDHSDSDNLLQDDDDFSLQDTIPQIVQACRSSRLQLVDLAPRLLEESAHANNSDVCSS